MEGPGLGFCPELWINSLKLNTKILLLVEPVPVNPCMLVLLQFRFCKYIVKSNILACFKITKFIYAINKNFLLIILIKIGFYF